MKRLLVLFVAALVACVSDPAFAQEAVEPAPTAPVPQEAAGGTTEAPAAQPPPQEGAPATAEEALVPVALDPASEERSAAPAFVPGNDRRLPPPADGAEQPGATDDQYGVGPVAGLPECDQYAGCDQYGGSDEPPVEETTDPGCAKHASAGVSCEQYDEQPPATGEPSANCLVEQCGQIQEFVELGYACEYGTLPQSGEQGIVCTYSEVPYGGTGVCTEYEYFDRSGNNVDGYFEGDCFGPRPGLEPGTESVSTDDKNGEIVAEQAGDLTHGTEQAFVSGRGENKGRNAGGGSSVTEPSVSGTPFSEEPSPSSSEPSPSSSEPSPSSSEPSALTLLSAPDAGGVLAAGPESELPSARYSAVPTASSAAPGEGAGSPGSSEGSRSAVSSARHDEDGPDETRDQRSETRVGMADEHDDNQQRGVPQGVVLPEMPTADGEKRPMLIDTGGLPSIGSRELVPLSFLALVILPGLVLHRRWSRVRDGNS